MIEVSSNGIPLGAVLGSELAEPNQILSLLGGSKLNY